MSGNKADRQGTAGYGYPSLFMEIPSCGCGYRKAALDPDDAVSCEVRLVKCRKCLKKFEYTNSKRCQSCRAQDALARTALKRQQSDEAKLVLAAALGSPGVFDPKLLTGLQRWTLRGKKALAKALDMTWPATTEKLASQCQLKISEPEDAASFTSFANEVAGKSWLEEGEVYQAITKKLPVYVKKREIVEQLRESKSLVLTAQTGAGKTTQIPQYFIDHVQSSGVRGSCAVLVPTRTIARGLASHVAELRGGKVGNEVGYALGGGDTQKGKVGIVPLIKTISNIFLNIYFPENDNHDLRLFFVRRVRQ
jgi:hypothetical protein